MVFMRTPCIASILLLTITPLLQAETGYADPKVCAECHGELCENWAKSDHSKSMDHATEATVLGDFRNEQFLHVGFDDILSLTDDEVRFFVEQIAQMPPAPSWFRQYRDGGYPKERYNVPGRKATIMPGPTLNDLVLGCFDAKPGVMEKLRRNMSDEILKEFDAEYEYRKNLKIHRPGDIAAAQDGVVRLLRLFCNTRQIKTAIGTEFRMYRGGDDKKFMVDTDLGPYEVKFTLGRRPLQQYLVETHGGRLQTLPIAWDTVQKRWFHLYPKEQIPKGDPLHWTAPLQNWNRMCADCHTTNLQKNFDLETNSYKTGFTEINVGCQTCHGPCGEHVETARKYKFGISRKKNTPVISNEAKRSEKSHLNQGSDTTSSVEVRFLAPLEMTIAHSIKAPNTPWPDDVPMGTPLLSRQTDSENIQSCVFCHTRRRLLKTGPKPPEVKDIDWFIPELVDGNVYYSDGQLLEEAFEYGSFMQSKMWGKGVGCTNCHDAHSLELKFQGNRLCTQCHSPSIYDTVKHHFHPDATRPGTQCVECHFPQSIYMVVDPRRDHSIRKPSPALTMVAGTPNACSICHQDRKKGETLEWARDHVDRWYAEKRKTTVGYSDLWPTEDHYALAIAAGRRGSPDAVLRLLKVVADRNDREFRAPIRAGALTLLGRFPLTEKTSAAFVDGLRDTDPWIRYASVCGLAMQSDEVKLELLTPMLDDAALAVRTESARTLARLLSRLPAGHTRETFEKAKAEYIEAQKVDNDQAATYLNLAVLEHDLASPKLEEVQCWFRGVTQNLPPGTESVAEARKTAMDLVRRLTTKSLEFYRQSIRLDADFLPSRINLAMLHHERDETDEAEKEFREALRIDPENGDTAYSLGLLYAEIDRPQEALAMLRQASKCFEKRPENAVIRNRVRYNLGLLLMEHGSRAEAEQELSAIVEAEPRNVLFLHALAVLYLKQEDKARAAPLVDRLIKLEPQNPQWRQIQGFTR